VSLEEVIAGLGSGYNLIRLEKKDDKERDCDEGEEKENPPTLYEVGE